MSFILSLSLRSERESIVGISNDRSEMPKNSIVLFAAGMKLFPLTKMLICIIYIFRFSSWFLVKVGEGVSRTVLSTDIIHRHQPGFIILPYLAIAKI